VLLLRGGVGLEQAKCSDDRPCSFNRRDLPLMAKENWGSSTDEICEAFDDEQMRHLEFRSDSEIEDMYALAEATQMNIEPLGSLEDGVKVLLTYKGKPKGTYRDYAVGVWDDAPQD
jgi:hypothetical protein